MELPTDWLTPESIVTLSGASAAVVAVANTCWKLFKAPPMVTGALVSVALAIYGALEAGTLGTGTGFIVAILNAFVLFSMAFGIDETLSTFAYPKGRDFDTALMTENWRGRPWLRPWLVR